MLLSCNLCLIRCLSAKSLIMRNTCNSSMGHCSQCLKRWSIWWKEQLHLSVILKCKWILVEVLLSFLIFVSSQCLCRQFSIYPYLARIQQLEYCHQSKSNKFHDPSNLLACFLDLHGLEFLHYKDFLPFLFGCAVPWRLSCSSTRWPCLMHSYQFRDMQLSEESLRMES